MHLVNSNYVESGTGKLDVCKASSLLYGWQKTSEGTEILMCVRVPVYCMEGSVHPITRGCVEHPLVMGTSEEGVYDGLPLPPDKKRARQYSYQGAII